MPAPEPPAPPVSPPSGDGAPAPVRIRLQSGSGRRGGTAAWYVALGCLVGWVVAPLLLLEDGRPTSWAGFWQEIALFIGLLASLISLVRYQTRFVRVSRDRGRLAYGWRLGPLRWTHHLALGDAPRVEVRRVVAHGDRPDSGEIWLQWELWIGSNDGLAHVATADSQAHAEADARRIQRALPGSPAISEWDASNDLAVDLAVDASPPSAVERFAQRDDPPTWSAPPAGCRIHARALDDCIEFRIVPPGLGHGLRGFGALSLLMLGASGIVAWFLLRESAQFQRDPHHLGVWAFLAVLALGKGLLLADEAFLSRRRIRASTAGLSVRRGSRHLLPASEILHIDSSVRSVIARTRKGDRTVVSGLDSPSMLWLCDAILLALAGVQPPADLLDDGGP